MTKQNFDPPEQPDTSQCLTLDLEHYQTYLDDPHISDDDKRALIKALWRIIITFVDLGFGIHPAQHPYAESCGQVDPVQDPASLSEIAALDASHMTTDRSA